MRTESLKLMGNALDAYAMRLKAISVNIANIDNREKMPRMSVRFEESLQEATHVIGNTRNLSDVKARYIIDGDDEPVLENELMDMADTQMRNQLVTRAIREENDMLRMGILGRAG